MNSLDNNSNYRATNECDCGHLIDSHDYDEQLVELTCQKCKCQEYHHTFGIRTVKIDEKEMKKIKKLIMKERKAQGRYEDTVPIGTKICALCGSRKTAKRMNGKERWHVNSKRTDSKFGTLECYKCYKKARKNVKQSTQ